MKHFSGSSFVFEVNDEIISMPPGFKFVILATSLLNIQNVFPNCALTIYQNSAAFSLVTPSLNPLTPNDHYIGRTAPPTSKRCILYIYSTNIGTEYFKHGILSPFFFFKMQFVS